MADQRTSAPLAAPGHAAQALAELFLHDADRFDGAGRRLAETHYSVDIPITGNSMGTALPNGTVIRVALGDGASCRVGDVVVFRQHEKVVAHRALAHARRHLITRGDARFAPDQPVEFACVLGRVSGVVVSTSTLLLPAIRRRHWLVRLVNFFAVGTTVLALRISPTLAGHWVGFLTWIERHMPTAPPPPWSNAHLTDVPAGLSIPSLRDRWNAERRQLARMKDSVLLAWRASPKWMFMGIGIALLQSVFPPLMLFVLKRIMDVISTGHSGGALLYAGHAMWLIGLAAAIAMADAAVRAVAGVVSEAQGLVVAERVHELLLAKSTLLEVAYYENHEYQDTFHRAQQEAPQRVLQLVTSLNQLIRTTATLLGMLVLLLFFDWIVILLLFAFTLPVIFIRARHEKEQHRWHERLTPLERQASYIRSLLTRIEPAKEIRLFDLGALFKKRFHALRAVIGRERVAMARRKAVIEIVTQILPEITIFGCLALLAYRGMLGQVSFGGVVVYFWALQWVRSLLNETLAGLLSIYKDNLFLSSLHNFLGLEARVSGPARPLPVPRPLQSGITVRNLSFRYAGKTTNALDEVNLVIRPGEKIALVGENGSGKSTLVKLLCRLYDPTNGEIQLDGISIRSFETTALRREISVVFQDFICYELTAAENISIGNAHSMSDESLVQAAAVRAGVHETILRLPLGYATQLGRRFEGGTELSIGEWQKIALARAFTRDSQILILDEPTSALDAEAEFEVFQRFMELAEGRTAILISHRLSTVRMAERIYVLDRGRIVESGNHDELMSRGAKYARLFNIQAQPYR